MKRDQILKLIERLSKSQGFYSKLWGNLEWARVFDPVVYSSVLVTWESKNFKDEIDFILYMEGGE